MATNNAPKHDFAPAWLKIPTQENQPSGSKTSDNSSDKNSRTRREDSFHNSFNRYGSDYARLHRQHSFDNYYENSKRYPQTQSKYRHHSVDDDYYSYPYPYSGYYSGYNYDKFGMQYGSQPSLFRGPEGSKYQHPNSRFGQLNGTYPGYYDLYPYEYYPGESYFNNYPLRSKRSHYEKDGRSNSRDQKDKESDKAKEKEDDQEKPFSEKDDFPSLNGSGDVNENKLLKSGSGGVWDNPPGGKKIEDGEFHRDKAPTPTSIYKVLVPTKTPNQRKAKDNTRLNGSFPIKVTSITTVPKDVTRQSPTPPMEILNTRYVNQTRNLTDKKSEFLKALRKENVSNPNENGFANKWELSKTSNCNDKELFEKKSSLVNGVEQLKLEASSQNILSSSLEAEQRLLREMGWNEQDEEEYIITEDDMKEFQKLTDSVKRQQKEGPSRTLPTTWSPKHLPVYRANTQQLNENLSSSDSDSEEGG